MDLWWNMPDHERLLQKEEDAKEEEEEEEEDRGSGIYFKSRAGRRYSKQDGRYNSGASFTTFHFPLFTLRRLPNYIIPPPRLSPPLLLLGLRFQFRKKETKKERG